LNFFIGILPDGKTLNLIPEGMVHETGVKCILGNGVVVNPKLLLEDFNSLKTNNIDFKERLLIS
jgi:adenylosuccinate synthase